MDDESGSDSRCVGGMFICIRRNDLGGDSGGGGGWGWGWGWSQCGYILSWQSGIHDIGGCDSRCVGGTFVSVGRNEFRGGSRGGSRSCSGGSSRSSSSSRSIVVYCGELSLCDEEGCSWVLVCDDSGDWSDGVRWIQRSLAVALYASDGGIAEVGSHGCVCQGG